MSVALWVNDASRGAQRARSVAAFAGGSQFGFLSMPLDPGQTTSPAQAKSVRDAGLRVNGHTNATLHPDRDAARIVQAIADLSPLGLVDVDVELDDSQLTSYMRALHAELRARDATHPLRFAIAPNKAGFLPGDLFAGDANLYATIFTYYGNMQGRFSEATALSQLLDAGVPRNRASVCYAATCDVYVDGVWKRALTLPSIYLDGAVVGTIGGGPVFDDDLLFDSKIIV